MIDLIPGLAGFQRETVSSVLLDEKYRGYVERSSRRIHDRKRMMSVGLESIESYLGIPELCIEAREALERCRPQTLGEALRLPGVRQADIDGLVIHLGRSRGRGPEGCST